MNCGYDDLLDNPDKLKDLIEPARRQEALPEGLGFVATQFYYTVRGIYITMHAGLITPGQADKKVASLIHRYYLWAKASNLHAKIWKEQCEGIKKSEQLRIAINKEKDKDKKLELTLECIRAITGDRMVK